MIKDYWIILKPELTLLSVFTATMSAYLAIPTNELFINIYPILLNVTLATFLLGGSAAILNQLLEINLDSLMKRTENRPLVKNRISKKVAWIYAFVLGISGVLISYYSLSNLAFIFGIFTIISYVVFYTPIKRLSVFSTIIGAIPGALPPVIGWTAVTNSIDAETWILFAILFLWQIPHFYSLGWMYRKDYERANFKILPVTDQKGSSLSLQVLFNVLLIFPISLLPAVVELASIEYFYSMIVVGIIFIFYGVRFSFSLLNKGDEEVVKINRSARHLFYATLIYLPLLFLFLAIWKI
ncbi:MAG: heme o synthase [Bacteroidetes bacterium]|nr:heme o synthase [Bacteroidota bacterium]